MSNHLNSLRFSEAYNTLYHFVWDDFADWYVETSKAEENVPLLAYGLESTLKLAHPFAPFVTETIWQTLAWAPDSILAASDWPEILEADSKRAKAFEEVKAIVSETRGIMKAVGVPTTSLVYHTAPVVEANAELIKRLARLEAVAYGEVKDGVKLTQTKHDVRLAISDEVAQKYLDRLDEQRKDTEKLIKNLEGRLKNKRYVENAPEAVVNQTRQQLEEAQARLTALKEEHARYA
jgi:valyl-tRNA synthetase